MKTSFESNDIGQNRTITFELEETEHIIITTKPDWKNSQTKTVVLSVKEFDNLIQLYQEILENV